MTDAVTFTASCNIRTLCKICVSLRVAIILCYNLASELITLYLSFKQIIEGCFHFIEFKFWHFAENWYCSPHDIE